MSGVFFPLIKHLCDWNGFPETNKSKLMDIGI